MSTEARQIAERIVSDGSIPISSDRSHLKILAETYLALEARCADIRQMAVEVMEAGDHNLKSVVLNYLEKIAFKTTDNGG